MDTTNVYQSLLKLLGQFPTHVPLEPQFEQTFDEGVYQRTRVTYMVEAGERIPAWLLVPKGEAPVDGWPAIVAIHSHNGQFDVGKSEPAGLAGSPVTHYGKELCQRGYVVICPDQLCFEERRPATYAHLDGYGYERFEFTKRVIQGSCLQTKYLHDLTCAVDLLASLSYVNRERLGAIGFSLGGQETLWLSWYDQRVRAAVSACGFGMINTLLRDGINHNFALYVPGMLEVCDHDTLAAMLAPRAFMMVVGIGDPLFPIDGVGALVSHVQDVYQQQQASELFQTYFFPGGHDFPEDARASAYAFLDRWLQ